MNVKERYEKYGDRKLTRLILRDHAIQYLYDAIGNGINMNKDYVIMYYGAAQALSEQCKWLTGRSLTQFKEYRDNLKIVEQMLNY